MHNIEIGVQVNDTTLEMTPGLNLESCLIQLSKFGN